MIQYSIASDDHAYIEKNDKVCFTVVAKHDIVLDALSTSYESVVAFGKARILKGSAKKAEAMKKMMCVLGRGTKYATEYACGDSSYVMVEITPEHISGKARR